MIKVESSVGTIEQTFVQIQSTFDKILTFNDIQLRLFSKSLKSCEDLIGYGIRESGQYYLSKHNDDKNQPPYEVHCQFHSDGSVETIVKNINDDFHEFEPCQVEGAIKEFCGFESTLFINIKTSGIYSRFKQNLTWGSFINYVDRI